MSKFCMRCGTENDNGYVFCKNCGFRMAEAPQYEDSTTQSTHTGTTYVGETAGAAFTSVDGIPADQKAAFIGKNAYKIMNKWGRMDIAGSKISWCWPVAVLSLLFGFFGTAIWFFYRKMYKTAFLLVGVAVLLLGLRTVLTYDYTVAILDLFVDMFRNIDSYMYNDRYIEELARNIESLALSGTASIASLLSEIETYAATIIFGMFSFCLYKQHAVKQISRFNTSENVYIGNPAALSLVGGTSGGMAFLGVVIMLVSQSIIETLPIIAYFLGGF